jgi:hypothetical protein
MKLQIATPCKADWSKMTGDERVRHCAQCKLNVYNLSELSEAEGQALIEKTEGRICARFFARPDGTVLTRDCPVGVKRKRRTFGFSIAAFSMLAVLPFFNSPSTCNLEGGASRPTVGDLLSALKEKLGLSKPAPVVHPMMGKISIAPPTPPSR